MAARPIITPTRFEPVKTSDPASDRSLACFISPHGFGHAARTAAVVDALDRLLPDLRFDLFTTVPRWLFDDSLSARFTYHSLRTDVGLIQKSSLEEDPAATVEALRGFLPPAPDLVARLARLLVQRRASAVVSDISPLGLLVAAAADLPSVLIENFTWDWIYEAYLEVEPRLQPFAERLRDIYARPDLHIQTQPLCRPAAGAVRVPPVSRRPRLGRKQVRRRLGLTDQRPMVLLTMGGVRWRYSFLERLRRLSAVTFVVPGGAEEPGRRDNLILLPHRSGFHHPDLVAAADAVVGKLGCSTVAEVYRAGIPCILVERPRFPESPVLARFLRTRLPSLEIAPPAFIRGDWVDALPELLRREPSPQTTADGASAAALHVARLLDGSSPHRLPTGGG